MRRVTRTIAAAGAAIVCCVTMTACSSPFGLPISGSVQTLAPVEQQTQRVYTNPQGPADDAQPETSSKVAMMPCLPRTVRWLPCGP